MAKNGRTLASVVLTSNREILSKLAKENGDIVREGDPPPPPPPAENGAHFDKRGG